MRALLILALIGMPALAQQSEPPAEPPEKPAEQQPSEKPEAQPESLPGLDELLGIKSDEPALDEERLDAGDLDPAEAELERRLSGEELNEEFEAAARLMDETADRIELARDTGLVTQRLQEDILRKLDVFIEQSQQQSQSSSSSSSSSSQQENQSQPNQQQNQQSRGDNRAERVPPDRQDGELSPIVAAAGAAWGALPERLRDSLMQGAGDPFSAMYRSLTESYYQRLAEEPDK